MPNLRYDDQQHAWHCRKQVRGREHYATFTRKADAEEWLRNKQRQAQGLDPLQRPVTLKEAWGVYTRGLQERGSPPSTLRYYKVKYDRLEEHFSEVAIVNRLATADIREYVAARQAAKRSASNRTVRAELALLYRMTVRAGEALEFDLIPQWRMPRFRIVERHRQVPTPAQLAAVWVRLEGPPLVALALCTLTGMRASEAFRARVDEVSTGDATIRLRGRKAGDELVVAITDTLAALLPRTGRLVQANEYQVSWALERASRDAGGPRLSGPGIGRHCFATWAVAHAGYTTEQIADALGHRRPGATSHYIHAAAVEPLRRPMAKAIEALLLAELGTIEGAPVLPFARGGVGPKPV
jgi:integrase